MGQPPCRHTFLALILTLILLVTGGCNSRSSAAATAPSDGIAHVASLSPAATDLIIAMGAADHLVAVSSFDSAEIQGRPLPHVGDYQTTDWETLDDLRPQVMILQMDPGRLPTAFGAKAKSLGIRLVDVRLNTMADVVAESKALGREIGETQAGEKLADGISKHLAEIKNRCAGLSHPQTLLTLEPQAEHLVGPGEFLNEALKIAGGVNVAEPLHQPYPTTDREMLVSLQPQVVMVLSPISTNSAQILQRAKDFWASLSAGRFTMPRIYLLNQPYILQPGSHVADVAKKMADCLHGDGQP